MILILSARPPSRLPRVQRGGIPPGGPIWQLRRALSGSPNPWSATARACPLTSFCARWPKNVSAAPIPPYRAVADRTSHDFSLYKQGTLERRIERRMAMAGLESSASYLQVLREDSAERERLAIILHFVECLLGSGASVRAARPQSGQLCFVRFRSDVRRGRTPARETIPTARELDP